MSGETPINREQQIAAAQAAMRRSLDTHELTPDESLVAIAGFIDELGAEHEAPTAFRWRVRSLLAAPPLSEEESR